MTGLAAAAILTGAVVARQANLGDSPAGWDEGAYLMMARLVRSGHRPFELPLFLEVLAAGQGVIGESVWTGRVIIVAFSLVGIAAAGAATWRLSNPWGAIAALALLALNPGHLSFSRVVELEMPSATLATLALLPTLVYASQERRGWLLPAGVLWALSGLVKPFSLGFGLALYGYPVIVRRCAAAAHGWQRKLLLDWLVLTTGAAIPMAHFIATTDLGAFRAQIVDTQRGVAPADLAEVFDRASGVGHFLGRDPGLLILALVGAVAGARGLPLSTLPLTLAVVGTTALLVQVPHFNHHAVMLLPALGILAGVGVGWVLQRLCEMRARPQQALTVAASLAGAAGALAYLMLLPSLLRFDARTIEARPRSTALDNVCAAIVRANSPRGSYVIGDRPIIVYLAGRLLPPEVAIPAGVQIQVGTVNTNQLVNVARQRQVPLVAVSSRFRQLEDWTAWIRAHYRKVGRCRVEGGDSVEFFLLRGWRRRASAGGSRQP